MITFIETIDELRNLLDTDDSYELIDVRSAEEFALGYIVGAQLIESGDFELVTKLRELDLDKTYIIYCQSGGRAIGVGQMMERLGFTNIYVSLQGMTHWLAVGYKVKLSE